MGRSFIVRSHVKDRRARLLRLAVAVLPALVLTLAACEEDTTAARHDVPSDAAAVQPSPDTTRSATPISVVPRRAGRGYDPMS